MALEQDRLAGCGVHRRGAYPRTSDRARSSRSSRSTTARVLRGPFDYAAPGRGGRRDAARGPVRPARRPGRRRPASPTASEHELSRPRGSSTTRSRRSSSSSRSGSPRVLLDAGAGARPRACRPRLRWPGGRRADAGDRKRGVARASRPDTHAARLEAPARRAAARLDAREQERRRLRRAVGGGAAAPATRLLLHGVTGSGKTEVYLRAAEEALARGRGRRSCSCPRSA